jgi:two-component system, LytTR family, sensor histidine kinase AlgZ
MHPILGQIRRLALYLLVWMPLAALVAYLMRALAGLTWAEAVTMSIPLCIFFAFVCLSAWYPCRATPLDRSSIAKLAQVHGLGAAVAAALWVLAAEIWARGLAETSYFPDFTSRLTHIIPLLLGLGVLFYLLSVNFYYVLLAEQASQEAEARVMQASILAREAELKALKAQVNPHFLFNSLNSISALTSSDAPRAREMCVLLGDFLRRTLGLGEKSAIPLEEELSLVRAFLAVEKIRFGARIQMEENVEAAAMGVQIPPLILQPLVENAIAHGIANLVEGGWIRLNANRRDGNIFISVENNYDPDAPPRRRGGVGLTNVRQRLTARYGERASFKVKSDGGNFRVELVVPAAAEERP